MSTATFDYELTGSGWADGRLQIGDANLRLTASYLSDALGDLLRAVVAIGHGENKVRFGWVEEPAEHRWIITRDTHSATVVVRRFEDWDNDAKPDAWGAVVFEATCLVEDLVVAVARGAQRVLDVYNGDGYTKLWVEHDFPLESLMELESMSLA